MHRRTEVHAALDICISTMSNYVTPFDFRQGSKPIVGSAIAGAFGLAVVAFRKIVSMAIAMFRALLAQRPLSFVDRRGYLLFLDSLRAAFYRA